MQRTAEKKRWNLEPVAKVRPYLAQLFKCFVYSRQLLDGILQ